MNTNNQIKYKNVLLKKLEKENLEQLRMWRNDKNLSTNLNKLEYITKEQQEKWYESICLDKSIITFAIYENEESIKFVGSIAVYNMKDNKCELGKFFVGDLNARNKKVGKNSWKCACHYIFEKLNMEEVICRVNFDNPRAIKIYSNTGFQIDSTQKKEYIMKLTKDEYYEKNKDIDEIIIV